MSFAHHSHMSHICHRFSVFWPHDSAAELFEFGLRNDLKAFQRDFEVFDRSLR